MAAISGTDGNDSLDGTVGDDVIDPGAGDDVVHAGSGNDTLYGGFTAPYGSHDLLYGEAGNDVLVIYPADGHRTDPWSLADGGTGNDTAYVLFSGFGSALTYVHNSTSADIHCGRLAGRLVSIEQIYFSAGIAADLITGGNGNDQIFGNAGSDTLDGAGGNDKLVGGIGTDIVRGGAGNDLLLFDGDGNDTFDGGIGQDLLAFDGSWNVRGGIAVDLRQAAQSVGGTSITVSNIESLAGTAYGDKLTLGSADGDLFGRDGDDRLTGGAGRNVLVGGAGSDTMLGGAGDDDYYVTEAGDRVIETTTASGTTDAGGTDTVFAAIDFSLGEAEGVRGRVENLVLFGNAAIAATGNALGNRLTGNGADNVLNGHRGADTMRGGAGSDTYFVDNVGDRISETVSAADGSDAGGSADTVRSGISFTLGRFFESLVLAGSDAIDGTGNSLSNRLTGNAGANALSGLGGRDVLTGNGGADVLTGGSNADLFVFLALDTGADAVAAPDRITDFSHAQGDRINLKSIDAIAGTGTNNAFHFIGSAAFSGNKGELHAIIDGTTTRVEGDTNGDKVADLVILLDGAQVLVAEDFLL